MAGGAKACAKNLGLKRAKRRQTNPKGVLRGLWQRRGRPWIATGTPLNFID